MLLFGAVQLVLSFIPNFHNMAWLSVVAAIMSFTYATIGLGLGLAKTIGNTTHDPESEFLFQFSRWRSRRLDRERSIDVWIQILCQIMGRLKEASPAFR